MVARERIMPTGAPRLRTPEGHLNSISYRLKARRKILKLTQDNLCGRLATATDGLWAPQWRDIVRIERGTRTVSDLELLALASALQCQTSELLSDADKIIAGTEAPHEDTEVSIA
jgi:transcriptional regulator with XRE-family HTH domain